MKSVYYSAESVAENEADGDADKLLLGEEKQVEKDPNATPLKDHQGADHSYGEYGVQ